MNEIGFLADLKSNSQNNKIERNGSIDKLLEIINNKCKESSECFEEIANSSEEDIRNNVKKSNNIQGDVRAIEDCLRDYCQLHKIDLRNYIAQYHSDEPYLTSIFLGYIKEKQKNHLD